MYIILNNKVKSSKFDFDLILNYNNFSFNKLLQYVNNKLYIKNTNKIFATESSESKNEFLKNLKYLQIIAL